MINKLRNIDIDKFSNLSYKLSVNNEFTLIYSKFSGIYRTGSEGNGDGLFIFSKLLSTYFLYDTVINLIIDLTELEYQKGNTLLKALCFFSEVGRDEEEKIKKNFIVISKGNKESVQALLDMRKAHSSVILVDSIENALKMSNDDIESYLE